MQTKLPSLFNAMLPDGKYVQAELVRGTFYRLWTYGPCGTIYFYGHAEAADLTLVKSLVD